MKYAVNFHTSFKHMDTVDEVILKYENDKQGDNILLFYFGRIEHPYVYETIKITRNL